MQLNSKIQVQAYTVTRTHSDLTFLPQLQLCGFLRRSRHGVMDSFFFWLQIFIQNFYRRLENILSSYDVGIDLKFCPLVLFPDTLWR